MAIPVLSIKELKMMSVHMSSQPTASWDRTELQLADTSCSGGHAAQGGASNSASRVA